jgi:phenylalanyl-tRNA synthetase beta subunit
MSGIAKVCLHGYPADKCWACHPEILTELKVKYEINITELEARAKLCPPLREFYQDIRCMMSVDIDWDFVFELCRDIEREHDRQDRTVTRPDQGDL